jgi:AcrR family transcriptional regulator
VLEVADQLFQDRGFAGTTVRDIAEVAGVSAGTVMAVGDKNALLVSVFDAMIAAEHDRRARSAPGATGLVADTCVDRVEDLVRPFVLLFTERHELARTYASILMSGRHSSPLFTQLADQLIEELAAAITVRECTSTAAAAGTAQALYAAYVGTLVTWAALGSDDRTALFRRLRTTFAAICTCKE